LPVVAVCLRRAHLQIVRAGDAAVCDRSEASSAGEGTAARADARGAAGLGHAAAAAAGWLPVRRQAPVGPFIADFAWLGGRIVVEVDGGQHATDEGLAADLKREAWFGRQGFVTVRLANEEVRQSPDACFLRVLAAMRRAGCLPEGFDEG
jgi:very-short-patch-repair endonuclease